MKIEMALQFFVKFSNIKFNQNGLSVLELFVLTDRQTDGRTQQFNSHSAGLRTPPRNISKEKEKRCPAAYHGGAWGRGGIAPTHT
jgi:hypothetical protein